MNTGVVTTGLTPFIVGSIETFVCQPFLNGLAWDLTGGSAVVTFVDPNGITYNVPATVSPSITAGWAIIGPAGKWFRWWTLTDASGIVQVSQMILFDVQQNPILQG